MTYEEFCETGRNAVNDTLEKMITSLDCPDDMKTAMRYTLLAPGKRIRPLLSLMAADACGTDWHEAVLAGCSVEMVHAFSLIHDDLPSLDDDDERRGQPSSHKKFGEAQAILAGDGLLALPFAMLTEHIADSAIAAQCCSVLAKALGPEGMIGGQWDDIRSNVQLDASMLESLHQRKTGALIEASLVLGGFVAKASSDQLEALREYGRNVGLAFQITDDLLDSENKEQTSFVALFGEEESKSRATQLIANAIQSIALFDKRSAYLEAFARSIVDRKI